MPSFNAKRNENIDLIRGLSILAVILFHINIRIPFDKSPLGKLFPHALYSTLFWSGYYGVIVFFVVSGFLITTSAINKWGTIQNVKCRQFYLLRFARIVPCLIALLFILSVLDLLRAKGFVIHATTLPHALFAALTFHINWLEARFGYLPGSWDVLWSLSVEEAFYIIFPLLCLTVRNETSLKLLLLVFIVLGPFARVGFSHNEIWMDHSYLSCSDGIVMGCLAALYANKLKLTKRRIQTFFLLGFSLFVFVFIFRSFVYDSGLTRIGLNVTILEIGIALMLIALSKPKRQATYSKNTTAIFRWFGRNSYETYLTHMFVVVFAVQLFQDIHAPYRNNLLLWYGVILGLIGIVGGLVVRYYSVPLNKIIRDRFSVQREVE